MVHPGIVNTQLVSIILHSLHGNVHHVRAAEGCTESKAQEKVRGKPETSEDARDQIANSAWPKQPKFSGADRHADGDA